MVNSIALSQLTDRSERLSRSPIHTLMAEAAERCRPAHQEQRVLQYLAQDSLQHAAGGSQRTELATFRLPRQPALPTELQPPEI